MSAPGQQKASMLQVKAIIRRKLRKQEEHGHNELNIYPMMDMMTILLVFLIMQFAQTAATVVQSPELQIPVSTSQETLEQATIVTISSSSVLVDGNSALSLRNGLVDPGLKQGGANGFLITPLLTAMQHKKELLEVVAGHNPRRPFTGDLEIVADKHTPYRTVIEVVYTCGQAHFANLRFVVRQSSQAHQAGIGTRHE